ncbi:cobalamin biosynthesis protein [Dongia sp.]|uniref:cobalamin biosynthesis protein n=1 Tax=Dongia sp. TaxID=1977262 RepID=UPI0035AF65DD
MSRYTLGIGHEKAAQFADLAALVRQALGGLNLSEAEIVAVASIDRRQDASLVAALAGQLGSAARYFTAAELEAETPRLANPSEELFRRLGCHGVAEAAALAAAGPGSVLILPKTAGKGVTCAIARLG